MISMMRSIAFGTGRPLIGPESTATPLSSLNVNGTSGVSPAAVLTTTRIGRLYWFANSKSRSSCAGTAMSAPVPYCGRTKLPSQIGISSFVNGLIAVLPVGRPSFPASCRSSADWLRIAVLQRSMSSRSG
jgi:hypothetical protein